MKKIWEKLVSSWSLVLFSLKKPRRYNRNNSNVIAVLRVFINKGLTEEQFIERQYMVASQIKNLLRKIKVGKIIIVADTAADKVPPEKYLSDFINHPQIILRQMPKGFTWCNALNLAMTVIKIANKQKRFEGKPQYEFVLDISNEAGIKAEHLEKMLRAMTINKKVGVVGTSFEGHLRDLQGKIIDLGRSYRHPRNTLMLIRLSAVSNNFRVFEPLCDSFGGMEDIYFILEMLALTKLTYAHLDLKVPLVVGVNYNQTEKEARERQAMDMLIDYLRSLFSQGTPERDRIDDAIAEMGIDKD